MRCWLTCLRAMGVLMAGTLRSRYRSDLLVCGMRLSFGTYPVMGYLWAVLQGPPFWTCSIDGSAMISIDSADPTDLVSIFHGSMLRSLKSVPRYE